MNQHDDIPAAKVEAVARAMCWAAGCMGDGCRAERRCRGLFWADYKADSVAAIRAADAWDAANRHAAMHGSADPMNVNVGAVRAQKWWAD